MEGKYNTASARWAAVGPYYAMFPTSFADDVVARFTEPGDWVLDPFAGRGTAVYASAIADRHGVGIELNPVGWLYGAAKLTVAPQRSVEARLCEIESAAPRRLPGNIPLPTFFNWCFSERVLAFLVTARAMLNWRVSKTDRTLMALILVYLHGKHDASLSNQMRQTKAMAPRYAVNWWRERGLRPPNVDPGEFLRDRIAWRYARGVPAVEQSHMFLGDCTHRVDGLASRWSEGKVEPARLLLTSPPYFKLTNYHYDQWLRLWMLGGSPSANRLGEENRGKFEGKTSYAKLLVTAFRKASAYLAPDAVIYVRTGSRSVTYEATTAALSQVFPNHRLIAEDRPYLRPTQTRLFGDHEPKAGEVDLVLRVP
jgi:DNA methylase